MKGTMTVKLGYCIHCGQANITCINTQKDGTMTHYSVAKQGECGPLMIDDVEVPIDARSIRAIAADAEDLESDAQTLRGYIKTHGETPAMTWSNRGYWKKRAERAEADIEKLKMDAEHLQYERDEAREKLAAEPDPRLREELALYREEYEARHSYGHKQGITSPQAKRYQEAKRKLIVFRALARTPPQKVENRE